MNFAVWCAITAEMSASKAWEPAKLMLAALGSTTWLRKGDLAVVRRCRVVVRGVERAAVKRSLELSRWDERRAQGLVKQ